MTNDYRSIFTKWMTFSAFYISFIYPMNQARKIQRPLTQDISKMTAQQRELKRKAFEKVREKLIAEKIESQVNALLSDQYLVYEKGTGKGISVSKDILMQSEVIKSMIENYQNLGGEVPRAIPITHSIDAFEEFISLLDWCSSNSKHDEGDLFRIGEKVRNLSIEKLVEICNIVDELDFTISDDCDTYIGINIMVRLVSKLEILLEYIVSIGTSDRDIDNKKILENFKNDNDLRFWGEYKSVYIALTKLNKPVQEVVLSKLIERGNSNNSFAMICIIPQDCNQLKSATSITNFLDIAKNAMVNRIEKKEIRYAKEQAKLWFWQRDKWF